MTEQATLIAGVYESQHPLVRVKLTALRDQRTEPLAFRLRVRELTWLLAYEALADLPVAETVVTTPLAETAGYRLAPRLGLVPILRAGVTMADAMMELAPTAQVWHLGLYRDETTHRPVSYYNRLPPKPTVDVALVLDPMLATGGSAIAAVDVLKLWGVPEVRFVGLIAAPEGVAALHTHHPDVRIHIAAVDDHLNADAFIVPGLGDAGDRQFGTNLDS
ncbi:MAG: uracil phosphoribosyltransferase [Dehalococcoidia bacterium]